MPVEHASTWLHLCILALALVHLALYVSAAVSVTKIVTSIHGLLVDGDNICGRMALTAAYTLQLRAL
eukprot:1886923-Amphidinium_carterae.1